VELSDDVNLSMPRYVVERVARGLNEEKKSLKGSRVLVLGVAYKRDVDDTRESPSLEVIRHLAAGGARVDYADPHVPTLEVAGRTMTAVALSPAVLRSYDAVVVATDHRAFPWDEIAREAPMIVDARGAVPAAKVAGTLWTLSGPAVRGGRSPAADAAAKPAREPGAAARAKKPRRREASKRS
jgi:UDP-N-acetyl-D-glucosamine dehydrogenase